MKKLSTLLFLLTFCISPNLPGESPDSVQWRPLLNESLDGWEVFTGVPHKSVTIAGYPASKSEDGRTGVSIGLSDPLGIFSIRDGDHGKVLHITGQVYAGLTSQEVFSNYHFTAQYKWGQKKWPPRENAKRDNGILIHAGGKHGAFWNVWLRSLECQVQETDTGDFIALAEVNARFATDPTDANSAMPRYQLGGTVQTIGHGTPRYGARRLKNHEIEGDWNRVDIFAFNDEAAFAVNGHVVMRLTDARTGNAENGKPLTEGRIQIQSEAAETDYRNIRIRPITQMPSDDEVAELAKL